MNALHELQAAVDGVLFGNLVGDADLCAAIISNGLPPERRLQVYRNNVYHGLTQALRDVYPVVERLVGEAFFMQCAQRYINEYPSNSGNLHDFGKFFSAFLGALDATRELVYLPDLATLEWAYHVVFHAADAEPLDVQILQAVPKEQYALMRFELHPACCLLRSDFPILKIWQAHQSDKKDIPLISLDEGGVRLAVLRNELDIEFHILSAADFAFLLACHQGVSFVQACEFAVGVDPDIQISETLFSYIQKNIVVGFSI